MIPIIGGIAGKTVGDICSIAAETGVGTGRADIVDEILVIV
jgi:hypothetical protein